MSDFVDSQIFLIAWISVVQLLLIASFSRKHPITEGLGLVGVVTYVSVYWLSWNAFLSVTYWHGGEEVFNWSLSPWIPSITFYLAVFCLTLILGFLYSVWFSHSIYSMRQRIFFSIASIVVFIGTIFN